MKSKLTLSDLLKLSIMQSQEMEDLRSSKSHSRKSAYRMLLRERTWDSMFEKQAS